MHKFKPLLILANLVLGVTLFVVSHHAKGASGSGLTPPPGIIPFDKAFHDFVEIEYMIRVRFLVTAEDSRQTNIIMATRVFVMKNGDILQKDWANITKEDGDVFFSTAFQSEESNAISFTQINSWKSSNTTHIIFQPYIKMNALKVRLPKTIELNIPGTTPLSVRPDRSAIIRE